MNAISHNDSQKPLMNLWGLALLLILILAFQLVGYFISIYALSAAFSIDIEEVKYLMNAPDGSALGINIGRFSNLIQFVIYMGIPALIFTGANRVGFSFFGGYSKRLQFSKILWAILLALSALPVVAVLTKLSHHLPLPDSIKSMADSLTSSREMLFENMLEMKRWDELLFCIFLAAFLPAILEEYLFRGIVLNIALSQYAKPATAIIFQAVFFSLMHLSLYEFAGIALIGALFGFITYRNTSVWYSSISHFVFNATTVTLYFLILREFEHSGIKYNVDQLLASATLAIPASLLMGLSVYKLSRKS
ncbi:MAG: hypothetical protein RL263_1340 [Bacteroidota bacterium]|jgi:membrane protease YdiL (CAAX protease family)